MAGTNTLIYCHPILPVTPLPSDDQRLVGGVKTEVLKEGAEVLVVFVRLICQGIDVDTRRVTAIEIKENFCVIQMNGLQMLSFIYDIMEGSVRVFMLSLGMQECIHLMLCVRLFYDIFH